MDEPWWKSAVIYQIYPRSFADSDGDGIGDLRGIRERLDHLVWLGVDAIWLSPFFRSPMADFGYDVSDYCAVDPIFGTLGDFDDLITAAHARGIRVLIDWVPNHTSDQHPWFIDSASGTDSERRDWYIWRDPPPDGGPPNNWIQTWTEDEPTWTFHEGTQQWYLHLFLPQQPDLNWANPAVVDAMHDVLRFWLDRGVDGFRMDVIHAIGKDPDLSDDPPELVPLPHSVLNHHESTRELIRGLRGVLDEYDGDRMMVGEVFLLDPALVARYYDDGLGLHLSFNFQPMLSPWTDSMWTHWLASVDEHITPVGWPTWVLSNHDQPRHRTRFGSEAKARAAAVLLLTLRGTPFMYAGEEMGLEDAVVPADRVVDPGGRDGCRAPIPWSTDEGHGWGPEPWLPWPPQPEQRVPSVLAQDPESIIHLYRRLLGERRSSPALTVGDQTVLDSPDGVVAWDRVSGSDRRRMMVNFTAETIPVGHLTAGWRALVISDRADPSSDEIEVLGPDQAVVLGPI